MSDGRRPAPGSNVGSVAAAEQPGGAPDGLDTKALRRISEEIARDFSPEIGRTALVLYDLDPAHLQAQWYVSPEDAAQALGAFPGDISGLRQVLRLCRLDRDGRTQVVAKAMQPAGSAPYRGQESFALVGDGASYQCEVGLEARDGGWLLLARSNRIWLGGSDPQPTGMGTPAGEAGIPDLRPRGDREPGWATVEAALAAVGGPLTPVFPNPGPILDPPAPLRLTGGVHVAGRDQVPEEDPGAGRVPEAEQGNGAAGPSRPVFSDMAPPRLPSDSDSRFRGGDAPWPLYDPRTALSSAALRPVQPRGTDLEVDAELVVRGRGHPGARIELFGVPVRVESDGRFAFRRSVDAALLLSLAIRRDSEPKSGDLDEE